MFIVSFQSQKKQNQNSQKGKIINHIVLNGRTSLLREKTRTFKTKYSTKNKILSSTKSKISEGIFDEIHNFKIFNFKPKIKRKNTVVPYRQKTNSYRPEIRSETIKL